MNEKKKYTFELEAAPISWLNYAQELREAANIIISNSTIEINRYPDLLNGYTLQNAFFLNFGYSLENLIKGTLIVENPNYICDHKISDQISKHHDMVDLIKKLKTISLSEDELCKLQILSKAIPYWGRYPIPKKASGIICKTEYDSEFHEDIEKIWKKLALNLYNLSKGGDWVSPSDIKIGQYLDSTLEEDMDAAISKMNEKLTKADKLNSGNVDLSKTIYEK